MEFKSLYLAIFGLVAMTFWLADYFKLFKKAELYLPSTIQNQGSVKVSRFINFLVGLTAWLLISFAMTGPRRPLKFVPSNIEVNDIFLVVDVSRSMLADDLRPNRLEVAKEKLRQFAALRPTDRLGVIIFSEKVFTLLPLTTDPGLVDQILKDIQIGGYLGSGTNIGDALALAVARGQASETKNKVVILLTDGVNNVGNMTPIQAAKMAKDYNMKVYTIGLGGKQSARIPIGKGFFGTQYQTIPGGSIDKKTLEEISSLTGGKTFMAGSENSLTEILSEIQQLEKTQIKSQGQVVYDELFFPYLLWGILLYLLHEVIKRLWVREIA